MEEILPPDESTREESIDQERQSEEVCQEKGLKARKLSWQKLRRYDSLDIESRSIGGHNAYGHTSKAISLLFLIFYDICYCYM